MIDVIIPAYNAKKTIKKTLNSIKRQKTDFDFNVYIVNDKSDYNYKDEINYYKKYFPIKELKLKENLGPGGAREYGINHSNNPYIIFIDSDDYFYKSDAIEKLGAEIEKGYDVVVSNFILDRDNKVEVKKNNFIWLHGKIYKREFLIKNDIHFNNTRANEDNGFNRLIILLGPKIGYLDDITYYYYDNKNSITRKNNRLYKFTGLEGYAYNMLWAINIAINKNASKELIAITLYGILVSFYYYYLDLYNDYDVKKILIWCKDLKTLNLEYEKYINEDYKNLIKQIQKKENSEVKEFITFEEFYDLM